MTSTLAYRQCRLLVLPVFIAQQHYCTSLPIVYTLSTEKY